MAPSLSSFEQSDLVEAARAVLQNAQRSPQELEVQLDRASPQVLQCALMLACKSDDREIESSTRNAVVRGCLQRGALVDGIDPSGDPTPLWHVVVKTRPSLVAILCEAGAGLTSAGDTGGSPRKCLLREAIRWRDVDSIECLLRTLQTREMKPSFDALEQCFLMAGHLPENLFYRLLELGASGDAPDPERQLPLLARTLARGSVGMTRALIQSGARLDYVCRDNPPRWAFADAIRSESLELVQLLLEKGVPLMPPADHAPKAYHPVLLAAALENPKLLQLFALHGYAMDTPYRAGSAQLLPLMQAARHGSEESMRWLVDTTEPGVELLNLALVALLIRPDLKAERVIDCASHLIHRGGDAFANVDVARHDRTLLDDIRERLGTYKLATGHWSMASLVQAIIQAHPHENTRMDPLMAYLQQQGLEAGTEPASGTRIRRSL